MSDWKMAAVFNSHSMTYLNSGIHRVPDALTEYRIGDLNMTQTVECHCGRRYLTQAQADLCPHVRPEPDPSRTGLGQWTNDPPLHIPESAANMVYHQRRSIPSDGFHGVSYDDDQ